MNMPTVSPLQSPAIPSPPIDAGPRRLEDDVFQSAEEAVLVEGQGNAFAEPLPVGPAAAGVRHAGRRGFSLSQAARAQVAARPCQSALLAAAAGALAMLVLRSQLRRRGRDFF